MRCNVARELKLPGAKGFVALQEAIGPMEFLGRQVRLKEPVSLEAEYVYDGGAFEVKGSFTATLLGECARCLKPIEIPLKFAFVERFVRGASDPETESYTFEGDWLDFDELVRDTLLLNLPVSSVCSPSCKGLCPQCGCDLNTSECSCESGVESRRPLSQLGTLLDENKEV